MSGPLVTSGAMLQCSCGTARACLAVSPVNRVVANNLPVASIMDHVPMVNILPFGMCRSIANPAVAAGNAATLGALTPMPCVPVTTTPWVPGMPTVTIAGFPTLGADDRLLCAWAGEISIDQPGQQTVQVP